MWVCCSDVMASTLSCRGDVTTTKLVWLDTMQWLSRTDSSHSTLSDTVSLIVQCKRANSATSPTTCTVLPTTQPLQGTVHVHHHLPLYARTVLPSMPSQPDQIRRRRNTCVVRVVVPMMSVWSQTSKHVDLGSCFNQSPFISHNTWFNKIDAEILYTFITASCSTHREQCPWDAAFHKLNALTLSITNTCECSYMLVQQRSNEHAWM